MAYDIYGNTLRRGHCEVHPHVHEEYPCSLCYEEEIEYEKYWADQMQKNMEQDFYLSIPITVRDPDLITDKRF